MLQTESRQQADQAQERLDKNQLLPPRCNRWRAVIVPAGR